METDCVEHDDNKLQQIVERKQAKVRQEELRAEIQRLEKELVEQRDAASK
jgi:hypothetical protein